MILILSLLGCAEEPLSFSGEGLTGHGPLWPFPSAQVVDRRGDVSIPSGLLPVSETDDGGTVLPVSRLNWRSGFSVAQASVALIEDVDPEALPSELEAGRGGSVRMIDLTEGRELICFGELDKHPDALDDPERQVLIIRPLEAMTPGHQIAVVVTTAAAPRPERFDALLGGWEPLGMYGWSDHYNGLIDELEPFGLARDEVALVWDFPVGDGTAMLTYMLNNTPRPRSWSFSRVEDSDLGDELPPGTWRQLTGTFETTSWLEDEVRWQFEDGFPVQQGSTQADLFIHVPESVRDAEPGTVPVLIFGHGLLTDPQHFLADEQDSESFVDLFNRMGVIVVGTTWRGLTRRDLPEALYVAADFGKFNELSERLTQGVTNNVALMELVHEGGLLDDPLLAGLGNPDQVFYYGVSAGSLLGASTLAQTDIWEHAILHVGGASWATTFERSANWADFEPLMEDGLDDPADRQLLLAVSQLLWDPVEPLSWMDELEGRSILIQESLYDDEVGNLGTEMLARSAGWPMLVPAAGDTGDLRTVTSPARGPVVARFDPELPRPEPVNRPAERTGAHRIPRHWESAKEQSLRFLDPDQPGTIEHPCGDSPCDVGNADL
ncbi:MAG: hypothetical protein H6740_25350 [Alphaproteobacteria bacterium]|nr:hypothetical protein [Alphaproteobacteria bacterium]